MLRGLGRPAAAFLAMLLSLTPAAAEPLALVIERAFVITDQATGAPVLHLTLAKESAKAFGELTASNIGKVVELRIDGKVVFAPVVRDPVLRGEVVIGGEFTRLDLLEAANSIWSGKAKVEVEPKPDQ